jgi:hypothetical protein
MEEPFLCYGIKKTDILTLVYYILFWQEKQVFCHENIVCFSRHALLACQDRIVPERCYLFSREQSENKKAWQRALPGLDSDYEED